MFSGEDVAAWAGEGPLVVDDHTRLDFTVPRSKDSFYGMGNLNTDYYLIEYMDERGQGRRQVALGVFGDKVHHLAKVKQPVLPHIANLDAYRLDDGDVARRLEAAEAKPRRGPRPGARR